MRQQNRPNIVHILILSQFYDPEPNFKGHALARALQARGHSVTAITGFPNYPSGRLYPGYRLRWRQWEDLDGVRVLRLPLYPDHSGSRLKRVLNYLSFAASSSLLGPALCGPANVMWVYHPPLTVGIPAWWIGLLRQVPFVYEVQDLWPESVIASGIIANGMVIRLLRWLERFIYHRAAAVTVISPGFKRSLVAKGVPAAKVHVIPNWADEEVYRPMPRDPELGARYGLTGRFNVMFAGNMGPAQALHMALQAASTLHDLPAIQFTLIGDGIELPHLQHEARRLGLTNVRFIERQAAAEMPRFFAWADALLVSLGKGYQATIPSKTIAYLACGRPILCSVAGDAADVVRETGAGLVCPPEDPATLAQAVRDLYAMPAERREAMGQAGRQAFLAHYTQAVLVDRYESLLSQVAHTGA